MLLKILEDNKPIGLIKYEDGKLLIGGQTSVIRRLISDNKTGSWFNTLIKLPKLLNEPYKAVILDKSVTIFGKNHQLQRLENSAEAFVRGVILGPSRFMGSGV